MHRHPFDPLAFFFGVLFLIVGLLLLNGGTDGIPLEWAGPLTALALGALIALTAARPRRTRADEEPAE